MKEDRIDVERYGVLERDEFDTVEWFEELKGDNQGEIKTAEEWISVKDKMPDYDQYVLWIDEDGHQFVDCLDKDGNHFLDGEDTEVIALFGKCPQATHWQPLPPPPQFKGQITG